MARPTVNKDAVKGRRVVRVKPAGEKAKPGMFAKRKAVGFEEARRKAKEAGRC